MIRSEGEVRQYLVEFLAFRTPWAEKVAWGGPISGLAERLGVAETALEDAAMLVRSGFGPSPLSQKKQRFDVWIPSALMSEVDKFAAKAKMTQTTFLRSVMHAAMQTEREPSAWTSHQWGKWKPKSSKKSNASERRHVSLTISAGLAEAICRRAAAYGLTRTQYVAQWIADVVNWKMRDLVVVPIVPRQTFDSARAYSLPEIRDALAESGAIRVELPAFSWKRRSNRTPRFATTDDE